jgi:excisionase family DNA binding protein
MERFDDTLFMTTSQVAELLDVHPSTVKRWCNDGDLAFDKTDGGHRRIHLADILDLTREREIHTLLDHFSPYEAHVWNAVTAAAESGSFDRAHALALGWLDRGHIQRMGWLFRELGRHPRIPFESFADDCVRGFMVKIGDLWRTGQLRSGEEHMTTEMLVETMLRLRDEDFRPSGGGRNGGGSRQNGNGRPGDLRHLRDLSAGHDRIAVVGAMEGDRHHLASLCLRIMLERRGWHVFYLGADVQVEDFAAIQRQHEASLVCVSFAPPNTGADMQRCVRILSEFYDPAAPWSLVMGGSVHPIPDPDGLDAPFEEFRIFDSLGDFGVALDAGLGRPVDTAA